MSDVGRSLATVHDEAWNRLRGRLEGLTDDEYRWEPVSSSWSLRRGDDARWRLDGVDEDDTPPPDPPPVTTIAWRLAHIGLTFIGFGDRLFRDGSMTLEAVEFPGSAAAALEWLDRTYREWWRDPMTGLTEAQWWQPIGPAFGPYAEQNHVDLALHVLDEFIHHAAEVGVLRDLYRSRFGG